MLTELKVDVKQIDPKVLIPLMREYKENKKELMWTDYKTFMAGLGTFFGVFGTFIFVCSKC